MINMDTLVLEDLGLSKGEIKVYLTLLKLGPTKVGKIIGKSKMASSAVHNSLNTLVEKGLVSYIKKGKIKFYQAVPAKQLIDFIEDKKERVLQILPELELKQKLAEEKQEAEIFEGQKGVIAMLNSLFGDGEKGDEYRFFATFLEERNEEIQNFFQKFDIKRKDKCLIVKGLAQKRIEHLFKGRKTLKMKFVDFPIPSNIGIFKGKVVFITWGDKPIGYLIKSPQIYEMFGDLFDSIWKSVKIERAPATHSVKELKAGRKNKKFIYN